jgi:hypothetical protein
VLAADAVNPRLSPGWLDYAQQVGFATDPTRTSRLTAGQAAGGTGGAVRPRQVLGWADVHRSGRRPGPGRDLVPGEGRYAGARHHREAAGRNVRRPNWRPAICCRCQSPTTSRSSPGSRCTATITWKSPGRCTRCRSICSARAWTPASTASAGHFLVSRRPHVTRRAMISRTQVRSARPPCVCTVRIRKWSSAGRSRPGRCPHTPLAAPPPPRQEHRRPEGAGSKEHHHRGPAPPRIPAGCEMDDHQDHAEDPDRRMTQDLDTPEM